MISSSKPSGLGNTSSEKRPVDLRASLSAQTAQCLNKDYGKKQPKCFVSLVFNNDRQSTLLCLVSITYPSTVFESLLRHHILLFILVHF